MNSYGPHIFANLLFGCHNIVSLQVGLPVVCCVLLRGSCLGERYIYEDYPFSCCPTDLLDGVADLLYSSTVPVLYSTVLGGYMYRIG